MKYRLALIVVGVWGWMCGASGEASEVSEVSRASEVSEVSEVSPATDYPTQPVAFPNVTLTDPFWAPRQQINREKSIPYAFEQCEKTGRVENFLLAADRLHPVAQGEKPRVTPEYRFTVPVFNDTDIYKGVEAASYDLAIHPDAEMDAYLDRLIGIVAEAQEPDGYLYTAMTCGQDFPELHSWAHGGRWKNLAMSHELYCAGHLFESATAHYMATGKRNFLDVAIRVADLLVQTFGPDRQTQIQDVPGHEVIEMGLVKLYRVTGNQEYLKLAKFFVDMRGRAELRHSWNEDPGRLYGEYAQDHRPITEQEEAVGHAVRATYYYAGAADVAALTGDPAIVEAVCRIWENVVSKKLYLIGGLGGTPHGEAFAENYDLPNFSGYSETCAQIGGVFWYHRMFLLDDHAKYYDVLERTIYNGLISGVSLSGDQFFYPNQQASRGPYHRAPWFGCACCPQNLMRFVASLSGYIYAVKDDTLYVGLYIANEGTVEVAGNSVNVAMTGNYPWNGDLELTVDPSSSEPSEWTLALRIPGWARNQPVPSDLYTYADPTEEKSVITVNGEPVDYEPLMAKGFARIRRKWTPGDRVAIHFPMPVHHVVSHPSIPENTGRVALERGPVVYCFEGCDSQNHLFDVVIDPKSAVSSTWEPELLGGVVTLRTPGRVVGRDETTGELTFTDREMTAVPYCACGNREDGPMQVWMGAEVDENVIEIPAKPTIASRSSVTYSFRREGGEAQLSERGMNDQRLPMSSRDESTPRFHWWPHQGTAEWVQYDFAQRETVQSVQVYWFDDSPTGNCRLPLSWCVSYRTADGVWKPVTNASQYEIRADRLCTVTFDPVTTDALRLDVQLKPGVSGGIHEWIVE